MSVSISSSYSLKMNSINFESANEKERIREELRNAREELLKRAQDRAAKAQRPSWMLPSLLEKIKPLNEVEKTHKKKEKKMKKVKVKKEKQSKKDKKRKKSSEDSVPDTKLKKPKTTSSETFVRDDWMTDPFMLKTFTKNKDSISKLHKSETVSYDPKTSQLELNKNWKNGGTGLPKFVQPNDDVDCRASQKVLNKTSSSFASGNWRKKVDKSETSNKDLADSTDTESSSSDSETEENKDELPSNNILTDQQMNELAAKIIKNEILGNTETAAKLKITLEEARANREVVKSQHKQTPISGKKRVEHILLTTTDKKGDCRPLMKASHKKTDNNNHFSNERLQFMNDDRYDLKQMFEREKYAGSYESNAEFVKLAGKRKTTNEDLEDIFTDRIQDKDSKAADEKEARNAARRYERLAKTLDNCDKCFDTDKIDKKLIISIGKKVYLSLPWYVGIQPGHCLIISMQHASCSTELDEDTWEEVTNFRKSLTRMFASQKKDVIFFETAKYLHRRPHLVIHCVPSNNFEMAQFYFKKAIQESEYEWSTNKQLISLKNNNLRSSIPKGLPYFWVDFGIETGFAHVLEEENQFPTNFAQEIIGGMLELNSDKWRKPRKEHNSIAKVQMFADWWKEYDCTNS